MVKWLIVRDGLPRWIDVAKEGGRRRESLQKVYGVCAGERQSFNIKPFSFGIKPAFDAVTRGYLGRFGLFGGGFVCEC